MKQYIDPEPFFLIPNEVIDVIAPTLKAAQLKTLVGICRCASHAKDGWVDADDLVLLKGTGLSERSLQRALKDLVDLDILITDDRDGTNDGHMGAVYGLNPQKFGRPVVIGTGEDAGQ